MKIRKLEWCIITNIGGGYDSEIPEIGNGYSIWFTDGKTITGDMNRNHKEHASKEAAMEWCQQDFENRIKSLMIE